MLWVPQTGCAFCKTEAAMGRSARILPARLKLFSYPGLGLETLLTSCCFFEGLGRESLTGEAQGGDFGAAAATPSQPAWALPAHRTHSCSLLCPECVCRKWD